MSNCRGILSNFVQAPLIPQSKTLPGIFQEPRPVPVAQPPEDEQGRELEMSNHGASQIGDIWAYEVLFRV